MSSPQFNKHSCRPRDHLIAAGKIYPGASQFIEGCRADRGKGLPDWPEWCFAPLAASYATVSGSGSNRVPPHMAGDVGRLGTLAAWRMTQGIYRFAPSLYSALIGTPVTGDIPHNILYRLPEWYVYLETPDMAWGNGALHGFFAHHTSSTTQTMAVPNCACSCGWLDGMRRGDFVSVAMKGDFGKPRPALVNQADQFDEHATVTVLPVTERAPEIRTSLYMVVLPQPLLARAALAWSKQDSHHDPQRVAE